MKVNQIVRVMVAALAGLSLWAQSADVKQPKPKTQKEVDAINAVFGAQDPDSRIAAVENLLTKFADTEFKSIALYIATASAEQKNDYEKVMIFGQRAIDADPKSYAAMLMMARGTAMRTREFDLDKDEKLQKAGKLADDALKLLENAPKPRPDLTDEQWNDAKKDFQSQGYEAKGMMAVVLKKYDEGIAQMQKALELQDKKDSSTMARLASIYTDAGKYDEAIALCDQIAALPDAPAQIKQIASQTKLKASTAKAQKK